MDCKNSEKLKNTGTVVKFESCRAQINLIALNLQFILDFQSTINATLRDNTNKFGFSSQFTIYFKYLCALEFNLSLLLWTRTVMLWV